MLTDCAAVAVFRFTPNLRRPLGILSGGQLDRFFKGKFLLCAQQAGTGLLALVVNGTAQIALGLPSVAGHAVLQHNGRDQAFDDLKDGGQIIGDQKFGLNR